MFGLSLYLSCRLSFTSNKEDELSHDSPETVFLLFLTIRTFTYTSVFYHSDRFSKNKVTLMVYVLSLLYVHRIGRVRGNNVSLKFHSSSSLFSCKSRLVRRTLKIKVGSTTNLSGSRVVLCGSGGTGGGTTHVRPSVR